MMKPKTKKLVSRITIDIIMYACLVATLFPIFWMVFTSLKSNNDILSGDIGFNRKANTITSIGIYNDDVLFTSKDGFIGKIDDDKVVDLRDTSSTLALSLIENTEHPYFMHSRGISSLDQRSGEFNLLYAAPKLSRRKSNFIQSTKAIYLNNKYYVSKSSIQDYFKDETTLTKEGLHILNSNFKLNKILTEDDYLLDPSITDMASDGTYLWIATISGICVLDPETDEMYAVYTEEDGLPNNYIHALVHTPDGMIAATKKKLVRIRLSNDTIEVIKLNRSLPDINTLIYTKNNMIIGTVNGLFVANLNTRQVIPKYNDEQRYRDFTALFATKDILLVGEGNGTILAMSNDLQLDVLNDYQIRQGRFDIRWSNYVDLWTNIAFGTYLKNSILICTITVLLALTLATLSGYALARFRFPGSVTFSTAILSVNMIPMLLFLIPIYLMFIKINDTTGIKLVGTYPGIIFVYSTFFVPMSIWILRSFFVSIPVDIEEAARIDGCSRFGIFWRIALPLAAPGIIATGIYLFLIAWDELMFATILLPHESTFTIPLGIKLFIGNHQNRFDLIMAASTIATLPVLILFFIVQKWFIKGLTAGAVKG